MLYVNTLESRLKVIAIACFKKDGNLLKVVLELGAPLQRINHNTIIHCIKLLYVEYIAGCFGS